MHGLDGDRIDSGLRRSAEAYQHASHILVAIDFRCGFLRIGNDGKQPQKKKKQTHRGQSTCVLFHFQNGLAGPNSRSERSGVESQGCKLDACPAFPFSVTFLCTEVHFR